MSYNDQQNGYFGGNRPDSNNTQANYDYIAGQNKKNAEDHAARMKASTPAYTPPAPSYTPFVSAPASSYSPPSSVSSYSGSSGGSYSGRYASEADTTAILFPPSAASKVGKVYGTPWAAIFLGIIVGFAVAVLPFALSGNFYHSPYVDKMALSMAVFCAGIFWGIVELSRGRARMAIFTALLGFLLPEVLWLPTTVTFLQAYSIIFIRALNHVAK